MENLKKGDVVKLETDINMHFPKGINMTVFYVNKDYIELCTSLKAKTCNVKKIGESQMQYEESNCYKLKQAIKKTGISSEKLSLATTKGKTKYHFYSYTKKSRLTDRGDISDARLNKLLTDLRHAEREVLGIGAKTVEDELYTAVVDNKGDVVDIVKTGTVDTQRDTEIQIIKLESKINYNQKLNRSLFFRFAILTTVILIALLLIFNSQVV